MTYVHFKFKIKVLHRYKVLTSISGLQIVLLESRLNGLWAECARQKVRVVSLGAAGSA